MSTPEFAIEYLDPRDLAASPGNFRRHPAPQRAALSASLGEHGWLAAPIVNRRTGMRILDGHARVELAVESEERLIPVRVVDVSEAQEKRILASFDRIGALAEPDDQALAALLSELAESSEGLPAGWGQEDLDALLAELAEPAGGLLPGADPDAIPEEVETRCKMGDLWKLGEHRILIDDSAIAANLKRLMGGKKAVLMATDPPYGVNLDQGWRDRAGLYRLGAAQDDAMLGDDQSDWVSALCLTNADVAYLWHADACHTVASESLTAAGFEVRQQIIWVKSVHTLSRSAYHWKHEPCWFAVRKGMAVPWMAGRDQVTVWEAASPRQIMSGSDEEKYDHPTQKPVELWRIPIRNHTRPSEIVYDAFLGSGTALMACEELGRACYACEIEPAYGDVALARWEQATGKSAERLE